MTENYVKCQNGLKGRCLKIPKGQSVSERQKERKSKKDSQHIGQNEKDKPRSTKHYTEK